jgi:hypothetical protein
MSHKPEWDRVTASDVSQAMKEYVKVLGNLGFNVEPIHR